MYRHASHSPLRQLTIFSMMEALRKKKEKKKERWPRFSSQHKPPSSDGFGLGRLRWLFVSGRTGHRADFWLNPPHCDERRGRNRSLIFFFFFFAAEALPFCKTFPPSLLKKAAAACRSCFNCPGREKITTWRKRTQEVWDSLSEGLQWLSPVTHDGGGGGGGSDLQNLSHNALASPSLKLLFL